jgi:hypothetical protein
MAESNWTDFTNGLLAAQVIKGVSMAPVFEPPDSAAPINGKFIYYFHTQGVTPGVAARYYDETDFDPTGAGKGGTISGCMRRYSGQSGFYPFFCIVDDNNINQPPYGYILGLTNSSSSTSKLMLRKGSLVANMTETDEYLRISNGTYDTGWFMFRLDLILNPQGDVVLNVYECDLDSYQPDNPTWAAVDGMDMYVDDSGGILTGVTPYTGGYYFGYGIYTEGQTDLTGMFDFIAINRQTSP